MSELRAPDPTLDAMGPDAVYVTEPKGSLSVAHRIARLCGIDPVSGDYQNACDARWFAVPCRQCFPDAPPPGKAPCPMGGYRDRFHDPATCDGIEDPHLAWQVPS